MFLGGVGDLTTLVVGVGFLSDSGVQLDHFLHHTPKLGISVEMVTISFETFVQAEVSCCAPRFPLILTAKFHSLYVKSRVDNSGKVGDFTSDSATLPWTHAANEQARGLTENQSSAVQAEWPTYHALEAIPFQPRSTLQRVLFCPCLQKYDRKN